MTDAPDVELHLTLPPTGAERLAALEAERDRERAAIQELEARLRDVAGASTVLDERGRFRGSLVLGFVLGFAGPFVLGFLILLALAPG